MASEPSKIRGWWFHKQGLDGSLAGASPQKVFERAGWSRSVGGSSPYIAIHSRAGTSREATDKALKSVQIHELPSARGCTYVVPKSDFALALKVGQPFQEKGDIAVAKKHLGVTEKELERLARHVLGALSNEALDPAELKTALGSHVRSLGDAGKRRGMTTTLPLVLGRLQSQGHIRRIPKGGRIDQQRYAYIAWNPNPLANFKLDEAEANSQLAKKYFEWIAPATIENFQWFSGLGVRAAKEAVEPLGLVSVSKEDNRLISPSELEAFQKFKPSKSPQYVLLGSIDSMLLQRRNIVDLVDPEDQTKKVYGERGFTEVRHLMDLTSHAILDRGRLIGLWEYDTETMRIVWCSFIKPDPALRKTVKQTEDFISEQLGDMRSFSLDSPKSRKPKIDALRKLGS